MASKQTTSPAPAPGSFVAMEKQDLQLIVAALRADGYRTLMPRVMDGAVVYAEFDDVALLPIGVVDEQEGGHYRLKQNEQGGHFDYVVGPHSVKQFLFPPVEPVLQGERDEQGWHFRTPANDERPIAVIGPRSCDLHAIAIQDRVFLDGAWVDWSYQARREKLFVAAVNCRRVGATCFCHAMQTGPAVESGFDLALTELEDCFVVEVGTDRGREVLDASAWTPCTGDQVDAAQEVSAALSRKMKAGERGYASSRPGGATSRGRDLNTEGIRDLLLENLEHPAWDDVAERCLSCGNCTMVCPTCFCSSVDEVADLTGDRVTRQRSWASCFTAEHSYTASGVVRQTTRSQYRQWLVHKLATWIDQFGVSGCVGCGRCITWCPVGIDLTDQAAAIRGGPP